VSKSSFTNNEVEAFKSRKKKNFKINLNSSSSAHISNFISIFFVQLHDTKFQNDFTQYYLLEIKLIAYDIISSYTVQAEDLMVYLSLT